MKNFATKLQRDLEKLNIKELREIANERGLNGKDAALYGNAQRRVTWVKLLTMNPEKSQGRKREVAKSQTIISINGCKPSKPKERVVYGMNRLPQLKLIVYSYGAKS